MLYIHFNVHLMKKVEISNITVRSFSMHFRVLAQWSDDGPYTRPKLVPSNIPLQSNVLPLWLITDICKDSFSFHVPVQDTKTAVLYNAVSHTLNVSDKSVASIFRV